MSAELTVTGFAATASAYYEEFELPRNIETDDDIDSFCQMNLDLLKDHHKASYAHVLRVVAIAKATGLAMGLNDEDILLLERAAKLHDVGKLCVSNKLLSIDHEPTEQQKKDIQDIHMDGTRGIILASKLPQELKELILEVVMWHHELFNLDENMNYPRGRGGDPYFGEDRRKLPNRTPSKLAKIITFADKIDRAINGYNNVDGSAPNLDSVEERMAMYMDFDKLTDADKWIFDVAVEEGRMIYEYGTLNVTQDQQEF